MRHSRENMVPRSKEEEACEVARKEDSGASGSWALVHSTILELIDELQNYSIVQVAAGDQHSLALTSWGLRDRRALVSSLQLLSLVHGLNFQAGCRVGWLNYDDCYIPEIAEKIDIRNDYLN
ncbi:hypothetical protein O3P69_016732 [Scylla paramamosain]|uniref:Uncharacterized protein n=1 Tax=Scylla paramamosain TaxID=85552 RepID=A0AAW0SZ75_SCYPA